MQNSQRYKALLTASAAVVAMLFAASTHAQTTIAYDNANLYPNNPDHGWAANNGGSGYNLWTAARAAGGRSWKAWA